MTLPKLPQKTFDGVTYQLTYQPPAPRKNREWEKPENLIRWKTTLDNRLAQPVIDKWLEDNEADIQAAVEYYRYQNNDRPWWQWDEIRDPYDPIMQTLRAKPAPPESVLKLPLPKVDYSAQEIPTITGQQKDQDQAQPIAQPVLEPKNQAQSFMAALTQPGMLVQGLISGGMTTAITPGPLLLKLAAGGASFYGAVSGKTGESIQSAEEWLANQGLPSMSHLLLYLDYPAEAIERSLGLISIGYGTLFEATKKTGRLFGANSGAEAVGDFIRNLPTAWEASHFTYEAMKESFGGGAGLFDPASMATTEGDRVLLELYRRMQSGDLQFDSVDQMNEYAMEQFGTGGLLSDLAGHMLLDPLNAVGAVSKLGIQGVAKAKQALAKTPEALKAAKMLELAASNADSGAEAIRTYGTMLRSSGLLTTDEISKMGGVTRWLAQVTRAGTPTKIERAMWGVKQGGTFVPTITPRVSALNRLGGALIQGIPMTVLGYGLGGPIGAGVLGGFGAIKGYWRFLTPTSRAVEALDNGSMAIARILNHAGGSVADPDQAAALAVKWVKAMGADNKGLAREISIATLDSPEASIVPHMLQDVGGKLDTALDAFKATKQQRTMLDNIARGLGMTTDDVLTEMKTADSAQALLRRYIDVAKTSTDAPAKSLFDQFNAKTLTGDGLQKAFLPFTRDNLPHNYETFMGQVYTMIGDHADKWAATYFGVKPDHLWGRIGRTIKNAQSAVLLGLNPSYLIQNTINNVVTAAVSGAFGLRTPAQIDNFWSVIMGVKPMRLSAGVGISGAGEDLLTGWSTRSLRGAAMDSGMIGKMGDAFSDLTQQMPMTRMSAAVERESSRQVYTAATIDAYRRMKRIGAGIDPVDRRLEGLLNGIEEKNGLPSGTLGEIIYHAIMSGDSREAIEKRLFGQVAKRQVDAFISQLADQVGLSEGTIHSTLEQTGTLQFLRDRLQGDYTPEQVVKTFNDLQRHMVDHFDDLYRKEVEGRAQYAADKVATEGVQGLVDIVYDQAGGNLQRRLQGLANWEHFWERIGSADRRQKGVLVRDQFEIENANWQRWWTWNESTWLGISKALGVESPVSRTLLKNTKDLSDSWLMAHTERNRLYREHFDMSFATPQERSAHWQQTKEAVRKVMDDAFTREIDINTRIGEQFTELLVRWAEQAKGAEYGAMVRQASEAWYTSLNSVLQKIGQDVGKFYDDVGKLKNQNEKNAAWVKFNEEHRIPQFKDIWTAQVDGVQGVYRAINEEPPAAVMPEEPPRPPRPPEQPQQPIEETPQPQPPTKEELSGMPELPAEQRPEITPEQRATRAEVLEIANQYDNLKTYEVDDAGMIVNKGDGLTHPKHVENILKNPKYGGDPGNTLETISPRRAKEILDNYQAFKREAAEAQLRAEMPETTPEPAPAPSNLETFSDRWQAEQAKLDQAVILREGIEEGNIDKAKIAYDSIPWDQIPNDLKPRFERLRKAEDAILNLRLLDLPEDIREDATAILNTMYRDVSEGEVVKRSIIPDTGSEGVKVTGGGTTYPKWYGEEGYQVYKGAYYWKIENGKKVQLRGKAAVLQALDDMRSGLVTRNALSQRLASIWWEEFQADGQLFAYLVDLTPKKTIRDLTRAEISISKLIDLGWLDQASEELSEFGQLVDEIYGENVPSDVSSLFDELLDSWSRRSAEIEAELSQIQPPPKVLESDTPKELRPYMEEIQQREELQVWAEEMQDDLDRFIKPAEQIKPPEPEGPQIAAQFGNVTFYRAPNGDLWRMTGEPGPVDSTTGMPGGARWEAPAHLADQAIEAFTGEKKTNVMPGGQAEMFNAEETMPLFTGAAMKVQDSLFKPVEQPRTEIMPGMEEAYKPGMKGAIEGGEAAGAGPLLPEQPTIERIRPPRQVERPRGYGRYENGKLYTATDREIPLPPKMSKRITKADTKKFNQWLIDQALAEAKARGDDWNYDRFSYEKADNLPPASMDDLNYYLFNKRDAFDPDEPLFQGTPTPTRTIPLRDLPTVRQSRETLRQQWEATGKYKPEELDAGMAILDAFALSQQRWTGMTPREWYARAFGEVRLGDASEEIGKALAQRGTRNIDTPEFARWFDGSQVVDQQGKPLFQGPKGAVQFGSDMRAVIHAFQSADMSTFLHESAHVFRRWLPDVEMNVVTAWLRDDHKLEVEHFGGAFQGEDEIVRQAEELYAQGFEQYIREGRAPTQGLQAHFEKLKQWLAAIYARLSGNPIVKITPEMRQHFDRILSGTDEVAYEQAGRWFETESGPARLVQNDGTIPERLPQDVRDQIEYWGKSTGVEDLLEDYKEPQRKLISGEYPHAYRSEEKINLPELGIISKKGNVIHTKTPLDYDTIINNKLIPVYREAKGYAIAELYRRIYGDNGVVILRERPSEMHNGKIRGVMIAPSTRKEGKIQATYFDYDGFAYDETFKTIEEAAGDAFAFGYRYPMNPKDFDYLVKTDRFQRGINRSLDISKLFQATDQTQQPAFKQWFGNSKVVDERGRPLVVYHGTKSENEFTSFNPGSHFGTSNQADAVLSYRRTRFEPGSYTPQNNPDERIIPVYLKIENPLRLRDLGGWDEQKIGFELDRLGYHDVGEKLRQTFEKSQALLDKIISSDTADVLRLYDEGIALRNANIKAALDELGYDGIVYKNAWEGEGDSYLVFEPTQIKSAIGNRGTFDPNDPNILYQHGGQVEPLKKGDDPEPTNMPLGTVDRLQGPPTTQMQEEAFNEYIWPILRQLEGMMRGREANIPKGIMGTIDPKSMVEVRKYLGKVYGQIADTKHMAIKLGEQKRDFALLNYSKRYEWDNVLGTIFPYEFWYTRSAMNWALRALERPAIFANYARTREAVRRMNSDKDIPTRLRNKIRLPMPYMQSERGAGVYVDPLRQLFPIDQLAMPFDRLWQQETLIDRRAQYILLDWQANEEITPAQAKDPQIIAKAKAIAEEQLDAEISNPLDLASTITGVSLPVQWGYNIARKKPDNIGQLPITRFVQSLTALAGTNQGRGYNMEGPLRRKLGMVEQSKYDQYFVERELARMVADGAIDVETAKRAMMDKQGEAYTQAQARVAKVGAYRNLASVVALDTFPESEAEIRSLRAEYEKAMEAREKGNKNAVQDFFDKYPEYEAQTYVGDDPEERLRQYLRSQVWEQYMGMDDLHKRQAREQLGNLFNDAFLDKETRSYDSISTETLTAWATQLGAETPKTAPGIPQMQGLEFAPAAISATYQEMNDERDRLFPGIYRAQEAYFNLPEGRIRELFLGQHPELSKYWSWRDSYLAEHPQVIPYAIGEDNKLAGVDPGIQALVYQYRADRSKLFPDVFDLQDAYFTLGSSAAKKGYLAAHPELKRYWDWQKDFMNAYPETIPYIKSTESIAKAVLGEDYTGDIIPVDVASWPSALVRQVLGYYAANQPLTAGAKTALRAEWKKTGSTETFNDWLDITLRQQLTGMGY